MDAMQILQKIKLYHRLAVGTVCLKGGGELTYTWVQFLIFLSKLPDTLLSFAPLRIAF